MSEASSGIGATLPVTTLKTLSPLPLYSMYEDRSGYLLAMISRDDCRGSGQMPAVCCNWPGKLYESPKYVSHSFLDCRSTQSGCLAGFCECLGQRACL